MDGWMDVLLNDRYAQSYGINIYFAQHQTVILKL
uniref:Uncharacterized protein n=1 Tax=Anguilla anguilla TaxID=7936 RepID=A0A0E9UBP2_ANGAN